ncbi:MAG: hypothetical protein Fur0010_08490 [Bdellovibrio sp.]
MFIILLNLLINLSRASTIFPETWVDLALEASELAVRTAGNTLEVKELKNHLLVKRYRDSYSSFQAFQFECLELCDFHKVFAISGTQSHQGNFDWKDWAANLSFGLQQFDSEAAHTFKNDLREAMSEGPVLLTGHSIGGLLAQTMLYEFYLEETTEIPVALITFASPGSYQIIERIHLRDYPQIDFNPGDVLALPSVNFAFKKDVVPRLGQQVGEVWYLPSMYTKGLPNDHWTHYIPGIGSLIKAHLYPAFKKGFKDGALYKLIPMSKRPIIPGPKLRRLGEKISNWWLRRF